MVVCVYLGPVLDSTKIHSRSEDAGSKNIQVKQVFLYIERDNRLILYLSGKTLLCICLTAYLCPVLDLSKIDSRSKDVGSKIDKRSKSLSLERESRLN